MGNGKCIGMNRGSGKCVSMERGSGKCVGLTWAVTTIASVLVRKYALASGFLQRGVSVMHVGGNSIVGKWVGENKGSGKRFGAKQSQ